MEKPKEAALRTFETTVEPLIVFAVVEGMIRLRLYLPMRKPTAEPMNEPIITTTKTSSGLTYFSSKIAIVGSAGIG